MFEIKNIVSGELKYKTDAMRKICINESRKFKDKETHMDIDQEKREEFIRASEERIYSWANSVGLPIDAVVKTAIYAELKTMYDVGHRHCDEQWDAYMEDMRQEHNLSERD